jgi:membrane-associated protease RseP (regulator of RpoE activity)
MLKLNFLTTLMLVWGLSSFAVHIPSQAQVSTPPAAKAEGVDRGQAPGGTRIPSQSTTIQLDGGKLIVIDQDGNEQEIDVGNAMSVVVRRSAQSKVVDGGPAVTNVTGKAIVVGPDGVVQEIEITGPGMGNFQVEMPDLARKMRAAFQRLDDGNFNFAFEGMPQPPIPPMPLGSAALGKYFIGVQCTPIDEALRSHLGLEAGKGLIISEVTPESPAEKAGLKNHDILLFAGEKLLAETADLVAVINEAGEGGLIVELGIIRGGKEMSVQVTPEERQGHPNVQEMIPAEHFMDLEVGEGVPGVFRVLPGLIRVPDREQLDQARQEMMAEVEKMRGQIERMKGGVSNEAFRDEMQRLRDELQQAHEEFRKAREEMLKSMQEMKRNLPAGNDGGQ